MFAIIAWIAFCVKLAEYDIMMGNMNKLFNGVKKIYSENRWLFLLLVILVLSGLIFLIHTLIHLTPEAAVVKTGYSDIGSYQGGEWTEMQAAGGYRDGNWMNMLSFSILAVILGLVHPFLAIKLYKKRGSGMAIILTAISILLVILAWVIYGRLLGEQ